MEQQPTRSQVVELTRQIEQQQLRSSAEWNDELGKSDRNGIEFDSHLSF